jgi:hypothetical protein
MLLQMIRLLLLVALLVTQAAPAFAANNGNGNGNGNGGASMGNGNSGENSGNGNGNAYGRDEDAPATRPPAGAITSEQDAALNAVQDGRAIPLEEILETAKTVTPGEVLDAHLVRVNGFLLYELKILAPNGYSVRKEYYYARSGVLVGR